MDYVLNGEGKEPEGKLLDHALEALIAINEQLERLNKTLADGLNVYVDGRINTHQG